MADKSVWDSAFPAGSSADVRIEEPDMSQHPQYVPPLLPPRYQSAPPSSPLTDYWAGQNAPPPAQRWEPMPGKKLMIGSILGIAVGVANGMGYDIGIQMTPGEGWNLAWGGLMGVFADFRFKKMIPPGGLLGLLK